MPRKIRLGVLFGGRSCEHEVSVTSARSLLEALDPERYEVILIGIAKDGRWQLAAEPAELLERGVVEGEGLLPVLLDYPEPGGAVVPRGGATLPASAAVDVVFPLLHGPFGEDGTVQGLLELAGIPYVGSGVLGSAIGMDKEMMKRVFRAEGLPIVEHVTLRRPGDLDHPESAAELIAEQLGFPVFVKPANLGSSVGVHRVDAPAALVPAIADAGQYDDKVLVEAAALDCREIECSVLGNADPEVSVLGEIVPSGPFYDYAAKYIDDTSELIIPAALEPGLSERVRGLARAAFEAIGAAGLARVDFFVARHGGEVFVNEINTMPGFTPISMYPKLWAASGVPYRRLVDRLVELALERHARRARLRHAL